MWATFPVWSILMDDFIWWIAWINCWIIWIWLDFIWWIEGIGRDPDRLPLRKESQIFPQLRATVDEQNGPKVPKPVQHDRNKDSKCNGWKNIIIIIIISCAQHPPSVYGNQWLVWIIYDLWLGLQTLPQRSQSEASVCCVGLWSTCQTTGGLNTYFPTLLCLVSNFPLM